MTLKLTNSPKINISYSGQLLMFMCKVKITVNIPPIYFELAEQNLWGVSGIYPFGATKEEQNNYDKLEEFQICYPLTSS